MILDSMDTLSSKSARLTMSLCLYLFCLLVVRARVCELTARQEAKKFDLWPSRVRV